MSYGILHLDGSGEDNPPISSFGSLYNELKEADGEHTDVSVINDDLRISMSVFRGGYVIMQYEKTSFHMRNIGKPEIIKMWTLLANGQVEKLKMLPWKPGYR